MHLPITDKLKKIRVLASNKKVTMTRSSIIERLLIITISTPGLS